MAKSTRHKHRSSLNLENKISISAMNYAHTTYPTCQHVLKALICHQRLDSMHKCVHPIHLACQLGQNKCFLKKVHFWMISKLSRQHRITPSSPSRHASSRLLTIPPHPCVMFSQCQQLCQPSRTLWSSSYRVFLSACSLKHQLMLK